MNFKGWGNRWREPDFRGGGRWSFQLVRVVNRKERWPKVECIGGTVDVYWQRALRMLCWENAGDQQSMMGEYTRMNARPCDLKPTSR